ncbi:phosphatidylserine synthase 2-like, partial [Oculina patagonica]
MGKPKEDTSRQNGQTHIDKDIVRANGHAEKDSRPFSISCEWDIKQTQQFSDDGTNTYFWRAHTVTVLLIMLCVLVYVGAFEKPNENGEYNAKRGLIACIAVFLLFGVTQISDGPFKRPHPAFWRLILCLSVVYELSLIFLLFQTADDARQLLKYLDDDLGKPLPEQSYGEDCRLYTPGHPKGSFHTFLEKCDVFLPAHFFGWWAK